MLVINFGLFAANLKEGSIDEQKGMRCVLQSPLSTELIMKNTPEQQSLYMHTTRSHGIKEKCKSEEN